MSYRVWRLGLASKYYEGRRGDKDDEEDIREILEFCLKEGVFPFHVVGLPPSEFPNPASYCGDENADATYLTDLWHAYNLIRAGDRVVLAKVRNRKNTFIFAKGTATSSARKVSGDGPFNFRVDVRWDTPVDQPFLAKSLKGGNAFYRELTDSKKYEDWEEQLSDAGELELYNNTMKNKTDRSLNTILCGPPGTGKTWSTRRIALELCVGSVPGEKEIVAEFEKLISPQESLVEFVTFHPSYDYADFIEGYKPDSKGNFVVTPGVLKRMAARATLNPTKKYLLIIDEINRGNISKIFGEAITLLEDDKRRGGDFPISLRLPTSPSETFVLPPNLYVLGTMNTADRSIAMLDIALRRRFDFEEVMPNPSLLDDAASSDKALGPLSQKKLLTNLNKWVSEKLASRDHQVGHAWLDMSKSPTVEKVAERFVGKVIPLLLEWFYEPEQRAMLFKELFRNPDLDSMLSAGGAKPDDLKKAVTECLYAIASAVKDKNPEPKG
jgi:AAA domain (dynein-related subfamily)